MCMIDPKQGPLLRPRYSANLSEPSRQFPPKLSPDTGSETNDAGKQRVSLKRQFSLVGS
jgi:hypothetical protein